MHVKQKQKITFYKFYIMELSINKCRICLFRTHNLKLLSADYLINGETLQISDIIISCTNIQITLDERFPNYICDSCLQDANIAYLFKKRCEQSENYLKSQLEVVRNEQDSYKDCKQCSFKFKSQTELDKHISIHNANKKYECNLCNELLNTENCLNNHIHNHTTNSLRSMRKNTRKVIQCDSNDSDGTDNIDNHNSDDEIALDNENKRNIEVKPNWQEILQNEKEKNEAGFYVCLCCPENYFSTKDLKLHINTHTSFQCKLCTKKFTLLSNLRRHYKLHDTSNVNFKDSTEYKCVSCEKKFYRRKQLSEHLKTHKDFTCPICKAKFSYATNLRKHVKSHNRPKDEIRVIKQTPLEHRTCNVCLKTFKYRTSMLKHRKLHDCNGKVCKFCNEIFENAMKLHRHMDENHENEKKIVCKICEKKFFFERNLRMHMNVHTGVKPYMCEICGISFALAGNLSAHKRLHTGHRPYKCGVCNRTFTQQSALRSHEASHSSTRDYICPQCGAAFSRAGALRNHRARHVETRLHACSLCPRRFTFSAEKKRHMLTHTGEKTHVCSVCGKAFNRGTNLNVHMRIHTGDMPYKCDVCGKGFEQKHCMITHRNTHKEVKEIESNMQV